MRDALPRVYGPKLDPAQIQSWSSSDQMGYGIQIGAFAAPGLFFVLFTILGCPLYCKSTHLSRFSFCPIVCVCVCVCV